MKYQDIGDCEQYRNMDGQMVMCPYEDELSDNQQQFIEDAESQGFDVWYDYSGRGMFGTMCPAIRVEGMGEFRTDASISWDNLGMGYVLYARR